MINFNTYIMIDNVRCNRARKILGSQIAIISQAFQGEKGVAIFIVTKTRRKKK